MCFGSSLEIQVIQALRHYIKIQFASTLSGLEIPTLLLKVLQNSLGLLVSLAAKTAAMQHEKNTLALEDRCGNKFNSHFFLNWFVYQLVIGFFPLDTHSNSRKIGSGLSQILPAHSSGLPNLPILCPTWRNPRYLASWNFLP